ncbi:MAG TPA: TonB-dependent receptor [Acidobacteriaceae bacterium]|nr:TonB-dependent receptor [Acidobacteriaceae bacterium]
MLKRMRMPLCSLCAVALLGVMWCGAARAQETSTINGTVTDPSGAVVPHAKVTLTNQETGSPQTTTTNSDGIYDMPGLAVGHYDLSVSAPGFTTYKKSGIVVDVAQSYREDAHLTVGGNNQTVTVQANTLQIQSETNEVSSLISGQQVRNIATNGRNITSLTTLGVGVSGNLPSFNGVAAQTSTATISFNGMRPDHNNFLIDGGEVYDRGSGGKLDALPSPDAISQFQVLSSNYSPDYGISSGGTVLIDLKSGGRQFHGGVWEFNRNDAYDAGYYFSKRNNTATPELRLNIFGGNIGGPLFIPHLYNTDKQKTFFFVNEEWRRFISGVSPTVTPTVPAGDVPTSGAALAYTPFNGGAAPVVPTTSDPAKLALYATDGLTPGQPFPNNTIPANLLDPNAVLMMGTGAIPKPNVGTDNYQASPTQPTYVREDVVRIDHNFSQKYHLMGSWIHDAMSQTIFPTMWSGDSYTTVGDVFNNPSWGAAVRLTQAISPTLLNETGLYVNGNTISVQPAGIYAQPSGWSATGFFSGNNADNRMPQVAFSGGPLNTTWTDIYWPWHNSYLDYQLRDDVSWTKGKHLMKFGFSFMREDKNQQQQADTEGDYSFNGAQFSGDSYVNFLLGFASSYDQLESLNTDHWLNNTYSFYAMDNWHVTPKLTLNLGFRYDLLPHVYEKNNRVANFNPAAYDPANAAVFSTAGTLCTSAADAGCSGASPGLSTVDGHTYYLNGMELAGAGGVPRGLVMNDYFTPEPRLGFAYDIFGNGRTVLRGGIGLFYERVQGNDIYNLSTNPPFSYQPSVNNVYFSDPHMNDLTGASSTVPIAAASMSNLDYYYPNPGTAQYSLGVQHQLAPSVLLAVQYVGSGGWNQDDLREINDLALSELPEREAVATNCKGYVAVGGVTACPDSDANLWRPYRGFSNMRQEENATNFNYNSLQAALRMDNRHGLSVQLAYTYSHEIDIQSADLTTSTEAGTGGTLSDPYNPKYDRGSGNFDRRHIFNANYVYNLPFFSHSSGFARTAAGGWTFSGITQVEAGSPANIYYNGPDTLGLGGNTANRPNVVGPRGYPKSQAQWFSTTAFADPVAPWNGGANNGFGTARKDAVVGPGFFNWNLSLYKDFAFTSHTEGPRFQLRVESFNTFNHTEFNSIDTGTNDSTYGQVTNTYDPRELQFGGKILF